MRYCKNCILPNSRPNMELDENGVCNASTKKLKEKIDWVKREVDFVHIVKKVKSKKRVYDCVIPVSGGKDSTWQVIKALEYDLNPLCVTWKSPGRNALGEKNLKNLIDIGINHIDFSINPKVEKAFTLKAFKKFGNPLIPMHMALHAIPLQIAINFKIPLILWGENSAFEYGGDIELMGETLNHAWLKKYGVTNETSSEDWVDHELSVECLRAYKWPSDKEQKIAGVKALFMGHFFHWDPQMIYQISKKSGFISAEKPKTGFYNYADIDDSFLITIHHWMKWYKFGFTRLWDNLSIEIRNGRMKRDEAIDIIKNVGNEKPVKEINLFCNYLGINQHVFFEIASKFRNQNIWNKNKKGQWYIENFLIDSWDWD